MDAEAVAALAEAHSIMEAAAKIVVIDGVVSDQLSCTEGLPHQAFVGSLREAPLDLMAKHLVGYGFASAAKEPHILAPVMFTAWSSMTSMTVETASILTVY